MKIARFARSFAALLSIAFALSSVVACTAEDVEDQVTTQSQSGPAPSSEAPPPVRTDTTSPSTTSLASGGETAQSLVCTLCKAQGCQCSAGRCVSCGLKAN